MSVSHHVTQKTNQRRCAGPKMS